jgi:hypothetical protein
MYVVMEFPTPSPTHHLGRSLAPWVSAGRSARGRDLPYQHANHNDKPTPSVEQPDHAGSRPPAPWGLRGRPRKIMTTDPAKVAKPPNRVKPEVVGRLGLEPRTYGFMINFAQSDHLWSFSEGKRGERSCIYSASRRHSLSPWHDTQVVLSLMIERCQKRQQPASSDQSS